jgi:hypothetical protein
MTQSDRGMPYQSQWICLETCDGPNRSVSPSDLGPIRPANAGRKVQSLPEARSLGENAHSTNAYVAAYENSPYYNLRTMTSTEIAFSLSLI